MVFIHILTEGVIKVNGKMANNMVRVFLLAQKVYLVKVNGKKESVSTGKTK